MTTTKILLACFVLFVIGVIVAVNGFAAMMATVHF